MGQDGLTAAGDHEAAGEQCTPRPFGDLVRFPGDERFIDLNGAGDHLGVGGNLVACGQEDAVVLHELGRWDGLFCPVPYDGHLGGGEERQLVQLLFGVKLLDDADGGVGPYDQQKDQFLKGAHGDEKPGNHIKDEVKKGKEIFQNDAPNGLGGGVRRGVDLTGLDPLADLGAGQSLWGWTARRL